MKNADVSLLLKEFEAKLNCENWLTNVGKFDPEPDMYSPFVCKKVLTIQQAKEWLEDEALWDYPVRISDNYLHYLVQSTLGENHLFNDVTKPFSTFFSSREAMLRNTIIDKKLKFKLTLATMRASASGAFVEFSANKIAGITEVDTNQTLLRILNDGYLPCGWEVLSEEGDSEELDGDFDGLFGSADNLFEVFENPFEYQEQPFDFSTGQLLVY